MAKKTTGKSQEKNPLTSWPTAGIDNNGNYLIEAYGAIWPMMSDVAVELACYRTRRTKQQGGLGAGRHLLNAQMLIWPHMNPTINEWMVRRFDAFAEGHKILGFAGGASTAKSTDAARLALLDWWALPSERAVIVSSTTINSLKKRIWSYISEYKHCAAYDMPGYISISPTPKMMFSKKDSKHGIHGVALREGAPDRTIGDLIGIHPKNKLLAFIDEATDVTHALDKVIPNWDSGDVEFQMIVIGNSRSKTDLHGKYCTPLLGWDSVDPDRDIEWDTAGGKCLYFDCYKSPAVLHPENPHLKFLIGPEKIRKDSEKFGVDDPSFWRFVRGFWPPEGSDRTVLTRELLSINQAFQPAEFSGDWMEVVAGFDPAFTSEGDDSILRIAKVGRMTNGLIGIDLGGDKNIHKIQLSVKDKDPISYQIVKQARRLCEENKVKPNHFGMDTWGFGAGAGDILQKLWNNDIHKVISIGAPTDSFVTHDMAEKAKELYDRRITELWFMIKEFVVAGQIRGLDEATAEELCKRNYDWKGKKICIETKSEYKKRTGMEGEATGSPDKADALAVLIDVVRFRLGITPGGQVAENVENDYFGVEDDWRQQIDFYFDDKYDNNDWESLWQEDAISQSDMFSGEN